MTLNKLKTALINLLMMTVAGCGQSYSQPEGPWNIEPNCIKPATTPTTAAALNNPYFNGYRLVSETFDNRYYHRDTVYSYRLSSSIIYGETKDRDSDSIHRRRSEQDLDEWGRLVGGTWSNGAQNLTYGYAYEATNNDVGKITGFSGGGNYGPAEIRYENNRIASIYNTEKNRSVAEFYYDDESHLVSYKNLDINLDKYFSCNSQNQITHIYTERDQSRNGHYEIEYDQNGNVSTVTRYHRDGSVSSTYTYKYQAAETPVFNHMLMRMELGFVDFGYNFVH